MNLGNKMSDISKFYFSAKGHVDLKHYWYFYLISLVGLITLVLVFAAYVGRDSELYTMRASMLWFLLGLSIFPVWSTIVVNAKRMHDLDLDFPSGPGSIFGLAELCSF